MPILTEKSKSLYFRGEQNKRIHYYHYAVGKPKGVLVICPGRAESALQYAEFVYDFRNIGFDIFVLDHRGQGISDRFLADRMKSHVDDFSFYIKDLSNFILNHVKPENYPTSVIMGHSMSGAIISGYLEKFPNKFSKVILVAPMIQINTAPYSEFVALPFAKALELGGQAENYAPGQEAITKFRELMFSEIVNMNRNPGTHSEARYNLKKQLIHKFPENSVGGATVHWVKTSLEWTRYFRMKNNLFHVPTLILQATQDNIVMSQAQSQLCARSANNCRLEPIKNAWHNILMESDLYRDNALNLIKSFLMEN